MAWLDDSLTINVISGGIELTFRERKDMQNALINGSCVLMLRNWIENVKYG